jgi:HEPN domain-containing protein
MKPLTAEWVKKAEADFATMEREYRARKSPNYDGLCFHAQQCADKYLKGRLFEAGVHFQPIHYLVTLLEQVLPIEPGWDSYREDLASLSAFAVAYRYPGRYANRATAINARKWCRTFRLAARRALGLRT